MSTRSSTTKLVAPFSNPESVIHNRRRNLGEPLLLFDLEENNMNPNNNLGPPLAGPIPQSPVPDLRTMEELCQLTMNGRGEPVAPVNIKAMDFGLKNHMIQQVKNSCQFHGLSGDDANKHLEKFLTVTQSMKQNGVPDDSLRLFLFPYSLTHHAIAWFDRLLKNSIHTFEEMVSKFLSKYFPPSTVTKLRNVISNFCQFFDESLSEAWNITSCRLTGQVNVVNPSCETCGGPHHYSECQAVGGFTQGDVYAATGNYNMRGKFLFPANFIVVDYDVDPYVPLILRRPFLRTAHALDNVHEEELILRVDDEKLVFNVESTSKYPHKHGDNPTPSSDLVVASLSPSLTPFMYSDFLLEEIEALLALDDSIPPQNDEGIFDPKGDILLLEKLLNDEILKDLPLKELKDHEIKTTKYSIEEPLELELKDLPSYLGYAFLEGTSKLPVIIAKDLKREEKDQLIKVMAFSVISISSDSSEKSVGTSTPQVILFGTIPTTIPTTAPTVDLLVIHDDTPSIPTDMPTISPILPTIPYHLLLLLYNHFTSDDSSQDSTSDYSSETSLNSYSHTSSDSSSRHSSSYHPISDSPYDSFTATFAGPSRKRCRSPTTSLPITSPVPRALSLEHADLLPPSKSNREIGLGVDIKDSYEPYIEPDIDPNVQVDIDACISFADDITTRGTNVRVKDGTVTKEEAESSARGTIEIEVDRVTHLIVSDDIVVHVREDFPQLVSVDGYLEVMQRGLDVRDHGHRIVATSQQSAAMSERIGMLEPDNMRLRGMLGVERIMSYATCSRMTQDAINELIAKRVEEALKAYDAVRVLFGFF
nr:reverse transcriptase domain-containing protein [Tanacetum cinerariifolium]